MTDLVATVRFALSRVTPGPWESEPVYGYPEDVRVYTAKENWHIATVGVQGSKKRTANAALIVGAPTWLAALCDEVERRRTENEMALATCDEYHEAETKLLAERATLRSDLEFARAQLASDAQTGGWRAQWAAERERAERADELISELTGLSMGDRAAWGQRLVVRAERAEALLNTPFPCPRCGRPGLLLRHMLPEPGRQWGHVPCLSRTDAEEQSDLRLVDVELRAERAEAALAEMDSDVPFVEIMARAKRTERAEARAERLRCALSDVLDHVRVADPAVKESAVRAQDALSEETK